MQTISITDFKARCLALLQELSDTNESLVITKHGKPFAEACAEVERGAEFFEWDAGEAMRTYGRIQILQLQLACHQQRFDYALEMLSQIVVQDIREGEVILSDLWWSIQEQIVPGNPTREQLEQTHPLPPHLDFRMTI